MNTFSWDDIKHFLAIVRTGNPARAAKHLGTDHTTVRRRIAAFEKSLNAKLLDRRQQRYVLTDQGEKAMAIAEAVESLLLTMEESVTETAMSGTVRVGVADALGSYFLAPRFANFLQSHPNLQIDLTVMSRQFSLSRREADITLSGHRPSRGNQVIKKLTDFKLALHASVEYLAHAPPINTIADLNNHTFIGYNGASTAMPELHHFLPGLNRIVRPHIVSNNMVAQFNAAVAGGGICFLPRYLAQFATNLRVVLPDVQISSEIWLSIHYDLRHVPRVRAVADFIAGEIALCKELFS